MTNIRPAASNYEYPAYHPKFLESLGTSTTRLAGLFGFDDTQGIWDLYRHDAQTTPIIIDWLNESQNIKETMKGCHSCDWLMDIAVDSRFHKVLSNAVHPTTDIPDTTEYRNLHLLYQQRLIYLWYIVRLVKAKPDLFKSSTMEPFHLDTKDVLHGWKLLSWTTMKGKKRAATKRNPPTYPAIKPCFKPAGSSKPSGYGGDVTGVPNVMNEKDAMDEGCDASQQDVANQQGPSSQGTNPVRTAYASQSGPRVNDWESKLETVCQAAQSEQPTSEGNTGAGNMYLKFDFDAADVLWNSLLSEIW
ncbi:hypothetical protein BDV06DRAFT_217982 [Aspergillus oleicola]